jgi:hypothetical protein
LRKISVALISCLAKKNMPMFMTGCCLAGLVAPLQRSFFWRWMAAAFVLLSGVDGSRFALRRSFWVFYGRAEAETGTGARVPAFELVPGLLVENLDTVAARMGMGLFVDCTRVSWSSNAFRTVSALTSGLVLSSTNGHDPVMMLTLPKSVANLAKRLKIHLRKEYLCQ